MIRTITNRLAALVALMSLLLTTFVGVSVASAVSPGLSKQWSVLTSSNAPAAFGSGAFAPDANGNVVSFGGYSYATSTFSNTTRVYSYGSWTTKSPATSPSARSASRMVWDAALNADILYGGGYTDRYGQPVNLTDTWKWNGTTWTQITTAHNPGALTGFNMAYDTSRGLIYLWGGYTWTVGNPLNTDLWSFDGTDWTKVTTTGTAPAGRQIFGFTYDPDIQANVLFGGCVVSSGCSTTLSDVYVQAGSTWTRVNITGPGRQYGQALGYSATLGGVLLQGGFDGSYMTGQSYLLTGSSIANLAWTKVNLPSGTPAPQDFSPFIGDVTSGGVTYVMEVTGTASAPGQTKAAVYVLGEAPKAPEAPVSPSASATSGTAATISWTAPNSNGSDITSYTVTSTPGNKTCTATAPATTCSITGLTSGTSYTFAVVATNAIGNSTAGTTSSYTMPTVPGAPTNVAGTSSGSTATITWDAPASNGGSAITSYTVTSSPGNKTCTATAPTTTCNVTGLAANTGYTFTVKATNVVGQSVASSASNLVGTANLPGAPTSVTASAGALKATVSWSAPASDGGATITTYTAKSTPGNKTCTATAPALTCDVTGLTAGTAYTFTVTATNGVGTGAASSASTSVTILDAPSAPQSVTLTPGQFGSALGQLTASWTAPARNGGSAITSYTATLNPGGFTCTVNAPSNSCVFNGANNNGLLYATAYTVSVVANTALATGSAATATATLSTSPVAPTFGSATASYSPNYYGVMETSYAVVVNCPTYWGSSVGTVTVTLTGSATYPATQNVSQTTTGCGTTLVFAHLPAFGSFTLTASAANAVATSSNVVKNFVTDGPLNTPQLLVTYNPSNWKLNISVTALTAGKALSYVLTDTTTNTRVCARSMATSFTCSETVLASGGLGEILDANLSLTVSSAAGYADQTFTYPVVINRLSCPAGNPTCTTIIGTYYLLNRGNLVNQDLSGLDISNSFIMNTDMTHVRLANTGMDRIKLQNVNMTNAYADGSSTSMASAYLNNVNFHGAQLNLQMALSSSSNMPSTFTPSDVYAPGGVIVRGYWIASGLSVFGADLSGANLSNIGNLDGIQFVSSNLSNANFAGDTLTHAYIAKCNLDGTNLGTDNMTGTSSNSNTGTVAVIGSAFKLVGGSIFGPGVVVMRRNLSGLDLSNLDLTGAVFKNSDLSNVNFTNSNLTRVNIAQTLSNGQTVFNPGLFNGANFTNAVMTGMWGISDSAAYIGQSSINVSGSAPAALPARVTFDARTHSLVLR